MNNLLLSFSGADLERLRTWSPPWAQRSRALGTRRLNL